MGRLNFCEMAHISKIMDVAVPLIAPIQLSVSPIQGVGLCFGIMPKTGYSSKQFTDRIFFNNVRAVYLTAQRWVAILLH